MLLNKAPLPPLVIFPEGTTSNTLTMTMFKTGAFGPENAVQPVCISYNNRYGDCMYLDDLQSIVQLGSQFINFVTVSFLHPYLPSAEEQRDSTLYANNVRKVMAARLHCELTAHAFEDVLLADLADKYGKDSAQFDTFTVSSAYKRFDIKASTALKIGKVFMGLSDTHGLVKFEAFQALCGFDSDSEEGVAQKIYKLLLEVSGEVDESSAEVVIVDGDEEVKTAELKVDVDTVHMPVNRVVQGSYKRQKAWARREKHRTTTVEVPPAKRGVVQRHLTFETFLVLVGVCYHPALADDALTLCFAMCDRDCDGLLDARRDIGRVIECLERRQSQSQSKEEKEKEEEGEAKEKWMDFLQRQSEGRQQQLMEDLYAACTSAQLPFGDFYNRIKIEEMSQVVQWLLQWVLLVVTGLKLDSEKDFREFCVLSDAGVAGGASVGASGQQEQKQQHAKKKSVSTVLAGVDETKGVEEREEKVADGLELGDAQKY